MAGRALLLSTALLPNALALKLPNGIGKLPALGWNSWNAYYCDSSEAKLLAAAQYMVDLGFKGAGYQYVNRVYRVFEHDHVTCLPRGRG